VLNVTSLLGRPGSSDNLRYGHGSRLASGAERRPVVVWNSTRTCNLACRHCYSDSTSQRYEEMSHGEACAFIEDIAAFGSPALLLSGGEPLLRRGVMDLIGLARRSGLAVTLSTNGTLITPAVAGRLKELGVRYVGISLDGIGAVHDGFRGRKGAFERTMRGIRSLVEIDVPVGLRITLTPTAIDSLSDLMALVENEGLSRVCFYHLVPSGRGRGEQPVDHGAVRPAVERIFAWAEDLVERGSPITVLTVDNYADAPALYLDALRRDPAKAAKMRTALEWNGGATNASGRGLAAVDWAGNVRPDQFWSGATLGNVRTRPLSEIWTDPPPALQALRERQKRLHGRCTGCRFRSLCGGGLASRALGESGDPFSSDPGCYLTDAEIADA
jgi:Fe-coproporphyrin III synthase